MDGVEAIQLDITSADDIAAAAAHCGDVTLLINNAGIGTGTSVLAVADAIEMSKQEFDTNVLGSAGGDPGLRSHPRPPTVVGRSSTSCPCCHGSAAPPIGAVLRGEGSLVVADELVIRLELHSQGTQVVAVHVGFMDTDMTAGLDVPKSSPDDVAMLVDGVQAGDFEVLADDVSRRVRGCPAI